MYRVRRAIDVATMAAVTTGARTAVDKIVTAARDDRTAERIGDGPRAATATLRASLAWARRARRRGRWAARARRDARSAGARCARAAHSAAPRARVASTPQGGTKTDRSHTPEHTNLSREGNFNILT